MPWSKILAWAKVNKLLAAVSAIALALVLGNALDGCDARSRAKGYFDLAKGWANAYHRDIGATSARHAAEMKVLTAERDEYRKKYEVAKARMNAAWKPPTSDREMVQRFKEHGFKARITK